MTTNSGKCGFFAKLFGCSKPSDPRLNELYSEKDLKELLQKQYPTGLPAVSIVSVLYKKAYSIPAFIEAIFRQSYNGPIEIVFVGDKSPDHSIAVARKNFRRIEKASTPKEHPIAMRLFTNAETLGSCASLNNGLAKAEGSIVIFADADCLFNKLFVGHHILALGKSSCDISAGPGNIRANFLSDLKDLLKYEKNSALMLKEAERAQNMPCSASGCNHDTHIFCDCKTRNFAALREKLPMPLFKEEKTCVEGQDMGAILASFGLKKTWTPGGFTLQLPPPPPGSEEEDEDDDDD